MAYSGINQEQQLLDMVERLAKTPDGVVAAHVMISKLKKVNREDRKLTLMMRFLSASFATTGSFCFGLSNDDLVLIVRDAGAMKELDDILHKILEFFKKDPLVQNKPRRHFVQVFSLEAQYETFRTHVKELAEKALQHKKNKDSVQSLAPVTPEDMEQILQKLAQASFARFVRHQAALRIVKNSKPRLLFEEFYVSLQDLAKAAAPGMDVFSDPWLFKYMTEHLDRFMLRTLKPLAPSLPDISVNINLSSVLSKEFLEYLQALPSGRYVTVEVQIPDVLANYDRYDLVKRQLQRFGHRVLIDGVTLPVLTHIDVSALRPDFVKLIWDSDFEHFLTAEDLAEQIRKLGAQNYILSRCDAEQAVHWGLSRGIEYFQGHYIDMIMGALLQTKCPNKRGDCSLPDCIEAARSLSPDKGKPCPVGDILAQAYLAKSAKEEP